MILALSFCTGYGSDRRFCTQDAAVPKKCGSPSRNYTTFPISSGSKFNNSGFEEEAKGLPL